MIFYFFLFFLIGRRYYINFLHAQEKIKNRFLQKISKVLIHKDQVLHII